MPSQAPTPQLWEGPGSQMVSVDPAQTAHLSTKRNTFSSFLSRPCLLSLQCSDFVLQPSKTSRRGGGYHSRGSRQGTPAVCLSWNMLLLCSLAWTNARASIGVWKPVMPTQSSPHLYTELFFLLWSPRTSDLILSWRHLSGLLLFLFTIFFIFAELSFSLIVSITWSRRGRAIFRDWRTKRSCWELIRHHTHPLSWAL